MPIDPSIPLQARAPHFMGPQDVVSLQNLAAQSQMNQLRVMQAQDARQSMDALKTFYSDRSNFDEKGYVKPEKMNAMMALNPLVGEKIMDSESTRRMREAQLSTQTRLLQEADRKAREAESQRVSLAGLRGEMAKPTEEQALSAMGLVRNPPGSPHEFGIANPQSYQQAEQTPFNIGYQSPERMEQLRLGAVPLSQLGTYLRSQQRPEQYFAAGGQVVSRNTGLPGPYQPPERPQAVQERLVKDPNSETGWSWEDARTLKRRQGAPPPSNASQLSPMNPAAASLHGDDYLKTLDPATRNAVESIGQYQADLKSMSMRTGERRMLLEHVKQAYPDFNQAKYDVRRGVMSEFTRGVAARNVTAINTAIGHMGTMSQMAEALNNGDMRVANAVGNEIMTQLGRPERNNYELAMVAVSDELMRVFRQVGASQAEADRWEKRMKAAGSPEQLRGALRTGMELLQSRIDALNQQWKRGMETDKDFPNLVDPKSVEALNAIRKGSQNTPALPARESIETEMKRRGLM